jgi:hypothetical protein
MQHQVILTRQALKTPRAAAVAGIIFAVLFTTSLVLMRLARSQLVCRPRLMKKACKKSRILSGVKLHLQNILFSPMLREQEYE